MENKVTSCFAPLQNPPKHTETIFVDAENNDIVEYEEYDVFNKVGEGDQDIVVTKGVRECSRMNRRDYINSSRDDVGILNIIKKVQLSGDATLLQQRKRPDVHTSVAPDGTILEDVQDYTLVQKDITQIQKDVEKGKASYDALPKVVTTGTSFDSFASMSNEELNALYKKLGDEIAAKQKAAKGEEK